MAIGEKISRGKPASSKPEPQPPIWWSNATFFVLMHITGVTGLVLYSPPAKTSWKTLLLCFLSWQCASLGITIGYHRLWSHRSFTAHWSLRTVLAVFGSLGFQGSIKWWVLRHRLHHRYTDDPVHDPYAASRGLFFSHMGWIFRKPTYVRMKLIEKTDLDDDPVVRIQHAFYIPIAIFFGLIVPTLIAMLWDDAFGGFIWGGIAARLIVWHCTFFINSLAHWQGLQPYSDETSAKGNLILAMLMSGEGNHNFHVRAVFQYTSSPTPLTWFQHAFPYDFRAGHYCFDWDPSKWIIWSLHRWTNLITSVKKAPEEDINKALQWMKDRPHGQQHMSYEKMSRETKGTAQIIEWTSNCVRIYLQKNKSANLLLIQGYIVDASYYLSHHPGGDTLLRRFAARLNGTRSKEGDVAGGLYLPDATKAFMGGLNKHSRSALWKMNTMRIARLKS